LNTEGETIRSSLEHDHQRLDRLLARASGDLDNIDMEAFGEFRRGLLKHVGMEEKILLPAIQQLRGGEPLPIASRLRLDHGAIAALLLLAVGLSVPDDAGPERPHTIRPLPAERRVLSGVASINGCRLFPRHDTKHRGSRASGLFPNFPPITSGVVLV